MMHLRSTLNVNPGYRYASHVLIYSEITPDRLSLPSNCEVWGAIGSLIHYVRTCGK